ncbi:hypothetical protein N7517_001178 [Penicillium concentricum]|uniref:Uncharacterized protein n=1 Tax=Penicillium concentricum TaxID=293559 RepID=A0A9W9SRL0_9EURO|nr:uncharacterized protein N7517_001178 [Penicillium concentricum]KAJ5383267.1 hypothetical protein N7517_001178 [Penicillium concentricum]
MGIFVTHVYLGWKIMINWMGSRVLPLINSISKASFIQLVRWPSWSKAHGSGQPDPDGIQLSPCLERGVGSNPTLIMSFCFLQNQIIAGN